MTIGESQNSGLEPASRRGFAKAAIAALAVAGFGAAALKGVLAGQDDDAEAVGVERHRRRRRGRRRRSSGGRSSGGRNSGGRNSGEHDSGGGHSGEDD